MISTVFDMAVCMLGGTLLFLLGIRCGKAEEQIKSFSVLNEYLHKKSDISANESDNSDDFQQDLHNILMYTGEKSRYE